MLHVTIQSIVHKEERTTSHTHSSLKIVTHESPNASLTLATPQGVEEDASRLEVLPAQQRTLCPPRATVLPKESQPLPSARQRWSPLFVALHPLGPHLVEVLVDSEPHLWSLPSRLPDPQKATLRPVL